ncbi:MAG: YlxR family protein [Clostridium sp.]|nr:YlxR family protein [Clostridium sp.]
MRQCIGCGQPRDKKSLIRIIRTTEGQIELDTTGKKNGRGAYLCMSGECLEKAKKSKGLERSFKMPIPADVYEELGKELKALETR